MVSFARLLAAAAATGFLMTVTPLAAQDTASGGAVRAERTVVVQAHVERKQSLIDTLEGLLSVLPVDLREKRAARQDLRVELRARSWKTHEITVLVVGHQTHVEVYVIDGARERVFDRRFDMREHGFDDVVVEQVAQATLGQVEAILQGKSIGTPVAEKLVTLEPETPQVSDVFFSARGEYLATLGSAARPMHEGELGIGLAFGRHETRLSLHAVGAYSQASSPHAALLLHVERWRFGVRTGMAWMFHTHVGVELGLELGAEVESARGSSEDPTVDPQSDGAIALFAQPLLGIALRLEPIQLGVGVGIRVAPSRAYVLEDGPTDVVVSSADAIRPLGAVALSIESPL